MRGSSGSSSSPSIANASCFWEAHIIYQCSYSYLSWCLKLQASSNKESCEWMFELFTIWNRNQTTNASKYYLILIQANLGLDQLEA